MRKLLINIAKIILCFFLLIFSKGILLFLDSILAQMYKNGELSRELYPIIYGIVAGITYAGAGFAIYRIFRKKTHGTQDKIIDETPLTDFQSTKLPQAKNCSFFKNRIIFVYAILYVIGILLFFGLVVFLISLSSSSNYIDHAKVIVNAPNQVSPPTKEPLRFETFVDTIISNPSETEINNACSEFANQLERELNKNNLFLNVDDKAFLNAELKKIWDPKLRIMNVLIKDNKKVILQELGMTEAQFVSYASASDEKKLTELGKRLGFIIFPVLYADENFKTQLDDLVQKMRVRSNLNKI